MKPRYWQCWPWMKEVMVNTSRGGAYLRTPVSTSVHFSLRNEGSSEYIRLCEGRESLSPNCQTFQDPRHHFHGIGRLVSETLHLLATLALHLQNCTYRLNKKPGSPQWRLQCQHSWASALEFEHPVSQSGTWSFRYQSIPVPDRVPLFCYRTIGCGKIICKCCNAKKKFSPVSAFPLVAFASGFDPAPLVTDSLVSPSFDHQICSFAGNSSRHMQAELIPWKFLHSLKGVWHKIFDFRFFSWINVPPSIPLGPFYIFDNATGDKFIADDKKKNAMEVGHCQG